MGFSVGSPAEEGGKEEEEKEGEVEKEKKEEKEEGNPAWGGIC